ncbi:TetR/AcrR family transcriptional regulator [Dictyobacter arantiisoli]|uniref:HTH-type transcriptional repressor KstR2 C-terminal domain-containing protein n=1 Tax=Dictyobacter arantiisoli TaxID=2014874 RepID=A0A5A5T9Q8_9CHLR|nr:TetR/AcrR family transcriptional regulator [Dictyobacter arantiisoli]GCF08067.1 hypothetical protein KDI_16310 [Dictyobacter arantiisoli]
MTRNTEDMLLVVTELFYGSGYGVTTMQDIAQTLHLRESHVHALLGSRDDMLWAIVSRIGRLFLDQARSVPRTVSPAEQLHLLIHRYLEVVAQDRIAVAVFLRDWIFLEGKRRNELQSMRETFDSYFYRVIDAGARTHMFQVPDPSLAYLFVLSALHWTHQWFQASDALAFVQLADRYSLLLLRALCSDQNVPLQGALAYLYNHDIQEDTEGISE